MFTNPALRGPSADHHAAPVQRTHSAATRPTPSAPGTLPSAPNAYRGIQLLCLADDLPHVSRTATDRSVRCGPYKLYPALARQPDGSEAVVFWTAFNTETKRGEFVVGPGDLAKFASAPDLYEVAAGNAYAFGEPNAWQRESLKTIDAAMREGPLAALRHLGKAWVAAVKDPDWWIQNVTAAGTAAVAAEGIATRAGRVPASELGRSTEIAPGGGLAAHEGGAARGHLLDRHLNKLDRDLVARANTPVPGKKPGKIQPPPPRASAFFDRPTAEAAASRTIAANEARVEAWVKGGAKGKLTIKDPTRTHAVGRSVERWGHEPTNVSGTELILVGDPSMPCGFRILTGFPTP